MLLDHENPRLGTVDSQPEALRELVELSPRNFETMMLSIKENGLDPGDLFYLVDESATTDIDGHTVVDGNRRVAALKVLLEPALLVGASLPEATVKRLRTAAEGFDPTKVGDTRLSILFDNRSEADGWIVRRHGRGTTAVVKKAKVVFRGVLSRFSGFRGTAVSSISWTSLPAAVLTALTSGLECEPSWRSGRQVCDALSNLRQVGTRLALARRQLVARNGLHRLEVRNSSFAF